MAAAVTNLAVEATGRKSASVTWTDDAANDFVEVYRGLTSSFAAASFVAMVAQGQQQYADTALDGGTTYYWWTKGRDDADDISATTGPVSVATVGDAGTAGTDLVADIVQGFKDRIAAVISSEYRPLTYVRELEKNDKGILDKGYGVLPKASEPGEPAIFGSYTQRQDFQIILTRNVPPSKGDASIETAELELYQWFDRLVRDFKGSRLYLSTVVRIGDPSAQEPEYLKDTQAVALKYTFPVTYRNTLS